MTPHLLRKVRIVKATSQESHTPVLGWWPLHYSSPGSSSPSGQKALVPTRAILPEARLGRVVDIYDAEALGVTVSPLEVVHERPDKIATQRHAVADGLPCRREVTLQVGAA